MSEMRKAQASVVFFLVFPYKVHLLSSPHLPLCKPHTWRQSYAGAIKITIGSSPLRAIYLSFPCFLHLVGDVSPPPPCPSSPWLSKGSSRVRAMHRSAVLPVAPTVTQQQQGLWVRSCPLPRQPVGCSVLGMRGKAGKTDSLCVGDGQIRAERRAGCSCPHCSFGQCNWGQGVQFTTCQPFGAVNRAICILAFYFFPLSK